MIGTIDGIVGRVNEGHKAFDDGDFEKASGLYRSSNEEMRTLLRSGAVKDEKSRAFLTQQCDQFKRFYLKAQKKALEKKEKDLTGRFRGLHGLDAMPKTEDQLDAKHEELQKRFMKLTADAKPKATQGQLEERLAALGPSQFPAKQATVEKMDPAVEAALEQARLDFEKDDGEAANAGGLNFDLDPELEAMMNKLGVSSSADEAVNVVAGGNGSAQDDQVEALIKQTRDYSRFDDVSATTDKVDDSDDGLSSDSSLTTTTDEDSDDSDYERRRKQKKAAKKKKKKKKNMFGY
mmetsp:Transcript_37889/g.61636  ORF Transcript_37889/g.61636 Transcript_37889/m.61636 type:complete len:292 (-) Transcript_37889:14-889(-)